MVPFARGARGGRVSVQPLGRVVDGLLPLSWLPVRLFQLTCFQVCWFICPILNPSRECSLVLLHFNE